MHLYIFVVDPFADRGPDMYVRLSPGFRVAIILPFQFGEDLMFNFSFDELRKTEFYDSAFFDELLFDI